MLNEPLPTRIKYLYRSRNEMAVELLNASGIEATVYACIYTHYILYIAMIILYVNNYVNPSCPQNHLMITAVHVV